MAKGPRNTAVTCRITSTLTMARTAGRGWRAMISTGLAGITGSISAIFSCQERNPARVVASPTNHKTPTAAAAMQPPATKLQKKPSHGLAVGRLGVILDYETVN